MVDMKPRRVETDASRKTGCPLRWSREPVAKKHFLAFDDEAYPGFPVARVGQDSKGRWLWAMVLLEEGVVRSDCCKGAAGSKQEAKANAEVCYRRARADWVAMREPWLIP